ncbi:La- protein 7 [Homalodisca vitripennis]|nr:La- protein 7 [Homalodisca vitripennis]
MKMGEETDIAEPMPSDDVVAAENVTANVPPSNKKRKSCRKRKKQLYNNLLTLMEFYLGDVNLSKDRFLAQRIQGKPFVYIDLSVFLTFNKVKALTQDVEDLACAIRGSKILQLSEDNTQVCRKTPINRKENEDECTLYVEQLGPQMDHDFLFKLFSRYGPVDYVSLPRYSHSGKFKGFAFVEFKNPQAAKRVLELFNTKGCRLSPHTAPEELLSIKNFDTSNDNNEDADVKIEPKGINDEESSKPEDNDLDKKRDMSIKDFDTNKENKGDIVIKSEAVDYINDEESSKPESHDLDKKHDMSIMHSDKNQENKEDLNIKSELRDKNDEESSKPEVKTDVDEQLGESMDIESKNVIEKSTQEKNIKKDRKKRKHNEQNEHLKLNNQVDGAKRRKKDNKKKLKNISNNKSLSDESKVIANIENEVIDTDEKSLEREKKRKHVDEEMSTANNEESQEPAKKKIKSNVEDATDTVRKGKTKRGNRNPKTVLRKRRRRRKIKIVKKTTAFSLGFKVLPKKEWKQLRNKYLNMQRDMMRTLKQKLSNSHSSETRQGSEEALIKLENACKSGTVLKVILEEPVTNVQAAKTDDVPGHVSG